MLGGYWMINVGSLDEAIAWASKCPAGDNEIIEIRQVQEMEDFPADVQAAAAGLEAMQTGAARPERPRLRDRQAHLKAVTETR